MLTEKEYDVYFASCVEDGGIYHYKLLKNGEFVFCQKTDCDRPMYFVIHDYRMDVILRSPFEFERNSGYISYELDENGNLVHPSAICSTKGECACHLSWFKNKLYVTNYLSGNVFCSDGSLCSHEGHSIHRTRQEAAHTHCILPAPDQLCLMVTDLGMDQIILYNENLNPLFIQNTSPGSGPRHLVCMEDGYVACVNELECSVSVYRYTEQKLNWIETLPLLERQKTEEDLGAAIRYHRGYLYASTRGADRITCFLWENGHLKRMDSVSCGGNSPRDFFLLENWLICMNEKSSTVTVFKIDENGKLRKTENAELEIPNVLCGASA